MVKLFKKILFNIDVWWTKQILRQSDSLFAYPILIHLEFNKDWYYQRYLKGISVENSVIKKADMMAKSLQRKFNRIIPPKVYHRLQRIKDHIEEQKEINESIELDNKIIEEYECKQQNNRDIERVQY